MVVTGISGRLGQKLARRLHRTHTVIGLDRRPLPNKPKDIQHFQIDLRRKQAEGVFRAGPIAAVFHLDIFHDPRRTPEEHRAINLLDTSRLLEYCQRYSIPKAILLSSADLYGPRPENPQFLTEEAPLLGGSDFPENADLIAVDLVFQSFFWKAPQVETVILRPAHIVGALSNSISRYLRLDPIPTLMGFDPMIQLVHEEDVVEAMLLALAPGVRGVFNLAGPGCLPLSHIVAALGRRSVPVPGIVVLPLLRRLAAWGLGSFTPSQADHLRLPCMVDDQRARQALGYSPRHDLKEILEELRRKRLG